MTHTSRKWMAAAIALLLTAYQPVAASAILGQSKLERQTAQPSAQHELVDSIAIGRVPAGFPVGFALLTHGKMQYVGYYDEQRRMTVASRRLAENTWRYQVLPSKVGWDSHNYITMAADDHDRLHVTGNMHGNPLVYFVTETAGDIATLQKRSMTGEREGRVTYPRFLENHLGKLVFTYRDGGSGNGMRIVNQYDSSADEWSRLLDQPLLDGQGKRNAYPLDAVRGPDGWFHLVWVWRDTPDCATNHNLSYARSRDLLNWQAADGSTVTLPLTLAQPSLVVDPIPSGGGIINGCQKLFFDAQGQPIISYHKADADGNMQIYAARAENGEWVRRVLTDWTKPVLFSGYGSMGFIGIRISGLARAEPGVLTMTFRHKDYGSGHLVLDEKTLMPLQKKISMTPPYPASLNRVQSKFPGISVRRANDSGNSDEVGVHYRLQWETLGSNRDRPRQPPLPEPSVLTLQKFRRVR
jgi:hypothetical protein